MENTKITCDQCGNDITYTGNSVDYRLCLFSEPKGMAPGQLTVTDMMVYPDVRTPMHFCHLRCLAKWVQGGCKTGEG